MFFEFHRRMFAIIGLGKFPAEKVWRMKNFHRLAIAIVIWVSLVSTDVASFWFILKFAAIDLENSLFALLQMASVSAGAHALTAIFFNRKILFEILRKFECICSKGLFFILRIP